jgi:hypothetical protein
MTPRHQISASGFRAGGLDPAVTGPAEGRWTGDSVPARRTGSAS